MKLSLELSESDLKELVKTHVLSELLNDIPSNKVLILVETKSKQNYRSEWEEAQWRVRVEYLK